jgi:hypothetical protein
MSPARIKAKVKKEGMIKKFGVMQLLSFVKSGQLKVKIQ